MSGNRRRPIGIKIRMDNFKICLDEVHTNLDADWMAMAEHPGQPEFCLIDVFLRWIRQLNFDCSDLFIFVF